MEEMIEDEMIIEKIRILESEIEHLDSIIEPHDCGHLITTRDWMKDRVRQLKGLPEEE
jgi:hypothetical protein